MWKRPKLIAHSSRLRSIEKSLIMNSLLIFIFLKVLMEEYNRKLICSRIPIGISAIKRINNKQNKKIY